MSVQFNDVSTLKGLVQIYEREMGYDDGFVSGNTTRLKKFAADVNMAWDDYVSIALRSSGTWQYDDSNHTDYPIIKTNIVQGQRDYTFTTDKGGNLILDIYRVSILPSATDTKYTDITPIDEQSGAETALNTEDTTQGVPRFYDKTGNAIRFDVFPSYSATNGLKVYINREASYFTSSDTTKKPGCPGIHHRYFALKPALDGARHGDLARYNRIREEVVSFEGDEEKGVMGSIERYFSRRSRDERPQITNRPIQFR